MWSEDQNKALQEIKKWWKWSRQELAVGGLAGTGKTTIAAHVPRVLGLRRDQVAYCCYTGKAAQVLTRKLSGSAATTIHSLMYWHRQSHCRKCRAWWDDDSACEHPKKDCCPVRWERRDRLDSTIRLVVVDEASMVDETIYRDLTSYGVRILWIGDHGQLPPVNGNFNLMDNPALRLEEIHRQAAGSPILKLAMLARAGKPLPVCASDDFELAVDDDPEERKKQLILCWRNSTRTQLNTTIRQHLGFPDERPVCGDRVICLRNNREAGVFNGMLGTITAIRSRAGAYQVRIDLDDRDRPYIGYIAADQFGQDKTLANNRVDLFDYGYCLTVHKAQGSEAEEVVLIDEYPKHKPDRARWLYTAITRAKRELTIYSGSVE